MGVFVWKQTIEKTIEQTIEQTIEHTIEHTIYLYRKRVYASLSATLSIPSFRLRVSSVHMHVLKL